MGRLDLRDPYRDEDFQSGGDTRNPGTRQVRVPPPRGDAKPPGHSRVRTISRAALGPSIPLALWILAFALLALDVHA